VCVSFFHQPISVAVRLIALRRDCSVEPDTYVSLESDYFVRTRLDLLWFHLGYIAPVRSANRQARLVKVTQDRDQVLARHGENLANLSRAQSGRAGELGGNSHGCGGKALGVNE